MPKIIIFCFLLFFINFKAEAKIIVSVASSLQIALKEIINEYSNLTTDKVLLNSASSGVLAKQIALGGKINIFISANYEWVDFLKKKDLVEEIKTKNFIVNQLALVKNCKNKKNNIFAAKKIAVGDFFYVPVGSYTENFLKSLNYLEKLKNNLVFTNSETQAVLYVKENIVDMAFVYYSSARNYKELCLVGDFEKELLYIFYKIALIKNFINEESLAFTQFIQSKPAITIFKKYYFLYLKN